MKWIIIGLLLSSHAFAGTCGENKKHDRRIRYLDFGADKIYHIQGGAKQPTAFIFDQHERVSWADCGGCDKAQKVGNVAIPPGWLITTSADQKRLLVRPQYPGSAATINVETSKGRFYTFEMKASSHMTRKNKYNTRRAHFCYPEQERLRKAEAERLKYEKAQKQYAARRAEIARRENMNHHYDWDRSNPLAPIDIRDDGKFTEFVFRKNAPTVGIYRVDVNGYDVSTNTHINGDTVIVQSIAPQFTIRRGGKTLCVFNRKLRPAKTRLTQGSKHNDYEFDAG